MNKKSVNNEKIYPLYIIGNHDTYHDSSFIPEPDADADLRYYLPVYRSV